MFNLFLIKLPLSSCMTLDTTNIGFRPWKFGIQYQGRINGEHPQEVINSVTWIMVKILSKFLFKKILINFYLKKAKKITLLLE